MSNLYEAGFAIDLREDLSDEIRQTLLYMIGSGVPGIEPSGFEHPLFQLEGYETEWRHIISSPREEDEEMLGAGCGSVLWDDRLVFRGLLHDDLFWNVWHVLMEWLSSLSVPDRVVGYYYNLDTEEVNLLSFESDGVCAIECINYSDFEDLQSEIVDTIESTGEE